MYFVLPKDTPYLRSVQVSGRCERSETQTKDNISISHSIMKASRLLFILIALAAGIGMGLAYAWYADPVEFFDLTPDTLRADYKADYVLMVAEAYHAEQDPGFAARRLAILGSRSSSAIASEGLVFARANGFADSDIALIQELVTAMQAWSGISP